LSSRASVSLAIEPAHRVGRIACIAAAIGGSAALLSALPVTLALPLSVLLILAVSWQAWRLGFVGGRYRPTLLQCTAEGEWRVHVRNGWISAAPLPESRVWRGLLWLKWETELGSIWTLLLRTQVNPGIWRQLQVRLRLPNPAQNEHEPRSASSATHS
jgi:hypothetical protein